MTSKKRFLVTGASGFLGARIAERLVERGEDVALLLRSPKSTDRAAEIYDRCRIIVGDLRRPSSYAEEIKAFTAQTVIHVAWQGVGGADRNNPIQIANIADAAALLDAAHVAGAESFIGFGSQAEYGPSGGRMDEETSTQPTTLYGQCKLSTGQITAMLCRMHQMRHAWIRVFSTYGPRDNPSWMIPSLIAKLKRREVFDMTACEQQWDYLYIDDAADAVIAVAEHPSAAGTFNLGSGKAPPLRQTVTLLRNLVAPDVDIGFGHLPYRPDQVMHLEANITRLGRVVGWCPKFDLETGLERTVEWFSNLSEGTK